MRKFAFFSLVFLIISAIATQLRKGEETVAPLESAKRPPAGPASQGTLTGNYGQSELPSKRPEAQPNKSPAASKSSAPDKRPVLRPGFAPLGDAGEILVEEAFLDGEDVIAYGDILIGNLEDLERAQAQGLPLKIAPPKLWEDATVAYEISDLLVEPERVREAIEHFHEKTKVRFIESPEAPDRLVFAPGETNCYSYVGRIGGPQKVSLSDNCARPEIIHELMHALGFFHEQNRADRDEFVLIAWDNIEAAYHPQYAMVEGNFTHAFEESFDFHSIMLYSPWHFAKYADVVTMSKRDGTLWEVNREGLSSQDVKRLHKLYKLEDR